MRTFIGELRDGWQVLRRQPVLFKNTLVSAVVQPSIGTTIALTVVYARETLDDRLHPLPRELRGHRDGHRGGQPGGWSGGGPHRGADGQGHMVVAGFMVMGLATVALGLTGNVLIALVAAAVLRHRQPRLRHPDADALRGSATPEGFMGRVVAMRSTLVFGALTGSMAVSGVAAEFLPVGTVIAAAGLVTVLAAIAGWLLPQVRDA